MTGPVIRVGLIAAVVWCTGIAGTPARAQADAGQTAEAPLKKELPPLTLDLGGGATVTLYGYVKIDFIHDRDFDLGDTTIGLKDIGTAGGPASGAFSHAHMRESRIGFDVNRGDLMARFEGDFFGPDSSLRLRHAYVDWNGFMVGQNWTNFMSVDNLSSTVDFQGPAGLPFARVPQVRYTHPFANGVTLKASVEEDVGNKDDVAFTAVARYDFEGGMVRGAAIFRDFTQSGNQIDGKGVNLAGVFNPWPGGKIEASITTGDGIADILAFGLSGAALYSNGDEVGVNAYTVSVGHKFTRKFELVLSAGKTKLDRAAPLDTRELRTVHLSAFYDFTEKAGIALEYFHGTRKQGNGASFDASRVQFAAKYSF